MRLRLRVWRQDGPHDGGRLVTYDVDDMSGVTSSPRQPVPADPRP